MNRIGPEAPKEPRRGRTWVASAHGVLFAVGVILAGLAFGSWVSAKCLNQLNTSPLANLLMLGNFLLGLLLVYPAALLLNRDARRATELARQVIESGPRGHLIADADTPKGINDRQFGALSDWSATVELLVGQVENQRSALVGLLDSLTPGVAVFSRKSIFLTANLSFCRMFRVDRDAAAGKLIQEVLPPAVAARWSTQTVENAHWSLDRTVEIEEPISRRRLRTNLGQIRPGKAEEALLALSVEDITDLPGVITEDSSKICERLLDTMSEAILLVEPDGCVREMNRAAAEALGYEGQNAPELKFQQLLAPSALDGDGHRLDAYVLSGDWKLDGRALDASLVKRDGSTFLAEVKLSEWKEGERRLVLAKFRDITKERQAALLTAERIQVVEMISKHQPLKSVLTKLALMIDHQVPRSASAVMLRQGDHLSLAASPNLPSGVTRCLETLSLETRGTSCAAAASQGQVCAFTDLEGSVTSTDLRTAVREFNLRSSWSAPILSSEGTVEGTIAVYLHDACDPTFDQIELLEAASRLASVCIEQHELTGQLAHRAQHDSLTGLINRASFEELVNRAIADARRRGRRLGVLSIDLDRFKLVNDTFGHGVGDQLLCGVARRLESCVREADLVARWGGDEFLIGLPDLRDQQDGIVIAGKLNEALRKPFQVGGHSIVTTATVGVSLYPDDGQDLPSLMVNADRAMYSAKTNGRNGFQVYTPELGKNARNRLAFEDKLGRALERRELAVDYQPLFDLKTGRINGLEALLRWRNPELGAIAPSAFIPVAEENGLIVSMGAWVLHEACRTARQVSDRGCPGVRVSVNVSSLQFARPDFVELVAQAVGEAGIAPDLLELELTESLLMKDIDQSCAQMGKLRALGVQVAIDDFGTGYSSLGYLQRLPIDSLKIDKCFVQELGAAGSGLPLVESIVALARSLGMGATAEGVESVAQLEALRGAGCNRAQGYLLGMPLSPDELEDLITRLPNVNLSDVLGRSRHAEAETGLVRHSSPRPRISVTEIVSPRLRAMGAPKTLRAIAGIEKSA